MHVVWIIIVINNVIALYFIVLIKKKYLYGRIARFELFSGRKKWAANVVEKAICNSDAVEIRKMS